MKKIRHGVVIALIMTLLAGAVWYSYYKHNFAALTYNDAMDYASMGRNIAYERGVMSSYITPLGLAHYGLPHPDLWRAPGWPLVLALFIKIFGATDQAVALASGVFYVAAIPFMFLLARYWFGNYVALAATIAYIFSAQNLHFAISGLTEPMALFLMILAVFFLTWPSLKNTWGDLLLGFVCGVFYLTRYNALLFVPLFAIGRCYLRYREDGKTPSRKSWLTPLGFFSLAFILTVSPWLWRNYSLMGNPLFSLQQYEPVMFTNTYQGYSLYTMFDKVDTFGFIQNNFSEMLVKVGNNWSGFLSDILSSTFTGLSPVIYLLFLHSFIPRLNRQQIGVRPLLAACFFVQLAALMVIHYIPRLFFMFMPFYAIFGFAFLQHLVLKFSGRKKAVLTMVTAVLLVCVLSNLPNWDQKNTQRPLNKVFAPSIKEIAYRTNGNDMIVSNESHLFAWYGDRNGAKLPYRTSMLGQMERYAPIKLIHLSKRISWNIPEVDDSWRKVYWGRPKELFGFKLLKVLPDGSLLYGKE